MIIKGIYEADKPIPGYVEIDGVYLSPRESQKAYNHSPDGFNWGYGGSGPAQLALAILLEVTNKEEAIKYHQDFKWEIIAKLPQGNFETEIDVKKWLEERK
jgi:hypothetical protein